MAMQGDDLKALRVTLGMTQDEFAEKLGLSRVMVGLMERGQKKVARRTEHAAMALLTDEKMADGVVKAMVERFATALADLGAESVTLSRDEAAMTLGLLTALAEQMRRQR